MNHEGHEKHEGVLAMQNAVGVDDHTPTGFCIHTMKVRAKGPAHFSLGHRPRLICTALLALSSAGVMPGIMTVSRSFTPLYQLKPSHCQFIRFQHFIKHIPFWAEAG